MDDNEIEGGLMNKSFIPDVGNSEDTLTPHNKSIVSEVTGKVLDKTAAEDERDHDVTSKHDETTPANVTTENNSENAPVFLNARSSIPKKIVDKQAIDKDKMEMKEHDENADEESKRKIGVDDIPKDHDANTNEMDRVDEGKLNFFIGEVFSSVREKGKPKRGDWCFCRQNSDGCNLDEYRKGEKKSLKAKNSRKDAQQPPPLTRSGYSLVSCTEVTPGAVQLWLELPEEVRLDPGLAPFKRLYDKENAAKAEITPRQQSGARNSRLPSVNSAPHLNNEQNVKSDADFKNGGSKNPNQQSNSETDLRLPEIAEVNRKPTKMAQARHYVKITLLFACWVFFTSVFLLYNEKQEVVRHSYVAPGEIKSYYIDIDGDSPTLLVKLQGPFYSELMQQRLNSTAVDSSHKLQVWVEKWSFLKVNNDTRNAKDADFVEKSVPWNIVLLNESAIDFAEAETRTDIIRLVPNGTKPPSTQHHSYAIRMATTVNQTTPFTLSYVRNPLEPSTGIIFSAILLCGLYILIIFEVINRTMAAVIISTTALAVLSMIGERPSLEEIVSWLDVETLLLLFSLMVLVAIMAETGMFDYLAVFTFQVTRGRLWPLINLLCIITALVSTILDNVTTVLLMAPVTIRLCEVMGLDPIPILMSMVLFSNIGGTATPVGDPPNVIIASNKAVVQAGINFANFTLHMTLGVLFVCVQTYLQLRYIYKDTNKLRLSVPRDIQELRHQISIWRRAEASLPHVSNEQEVVRQALEKKIRKLNSELELKVKETTKRACPKESFQTTLDELQKKYKIRDMALLVKTSVAIAFVVTVFFLHSIPELNRISLGWTALLGAIMLLILADREDLEPILHRVEWSTLLFFSSLFILMEALSKLGLIEWIGGLTEAVILSVDESSRLAVALVLMLWVSGISSAFVDNIPLTTMMVRVVTSLGSNPALDLPMAPLIWALSFGACLGGNGTLIGASANVVCCGVAEQHGYKMTFLNFFKIGFPVMVGHLCVITVYLLVCHCVFTWH